MTAFKLSGEAGTEFVVDRTGDEITVHMSMLDNFASMSVALTLTEGADLACWLAVACTGARRS